VEGLRIMNPVGVPECNPSCEYMPQSLQRSRSTKEVGVATAYVWSTRTLRSMSFGEEGTWPNWGVSRGVSGGGRGAGLNDLALGLLNRIATEGGYVETSRKSRNPICQTTAGMCGEGKKKRVGKFRLFRGKSGKLVSQNPWRER